MSKEAGALVPTAAVAVPAARTQKKKKTGTTSAKQNLHLSDIDEESIYSRKPPPEDDMPSYVPYLKRNTPRVTRTAATNPPTLLYVPSLPPIANKDCDPLDHPLDHTSPHKYPPAEFVEKVARAAADAADDDDEEEDDVEEEERLIDLLGAKKSVLDDLCYSDDDEDYDDKEYDDGIDEEARRIEYSDRNDVRHGRRQTNFIPGGPKPPIYDGMTEEEMSVAKTEYRKVRKKYTDGLRIKRLREILYEEYIPESFSGCLSPFLRPMKSLMESTSESSPLSLWSVISPGNAA